MTRVPLSTGAGPMCRNPTLSSACRSELSGLVAILFLVTKICAYHQIESGKITLYCDNKGAINNIFHRTYTGISQYLYTDSDLVICCKILAHPSLWGLNGSRGTLLQTENYTRRIEYISRHTSRRFC
jgi:hypothetical protein